MRRDLPNSPMTSAPALRRRDELTHKGNLRETRYGWLRLTPAYSVHLVTDLLERHAKDGARVLDPFCGTGTTALVCAERGLACDTTDINPFLQWLARAKTRDYSSRDRADFDRASDRVLDAIAHTSAPRAWTPPLHQIEKWWDEATLQALGRALAALESADAGEAATDLLKVVFCRVMIDRANVSFNHQSMSFKKADATNANVVAAVTDIWRRSAEVIARGASSPLRSTPRVVHCDARDLRKALDPAAYGCVITSPPYPNRMSYIRELRPYMYWLKYLGDGRAAGELDWKAIGGTWGCATSNVAKWKPDAPGEVSFAGFDALLAAIGAKSEVLARYVHKYFYDMTSHCAGLYAVTAPGATLHYIVGNSKFYEVVLPVERIFAALFTAAGFRDARVETIRKRTSKKELYEFVVSAQRP